MNNKFVDGLVSIIIPVYNSEKYLGETLDSIFRQTYNNYEIIIVDDCSNDHSKDIISQYIKRYPNRITYRMNERNSGVAISRNEAISIAKGQYIAFVDSDDVWLPNKLSKQIKLLENNKTCPMSYAKISIIDSNSQVIKENCAIRERISYNFLLRNTMIATSSVVINRNVVKDVVMPNRRSAEDYSLWLSILKKYGDALGVADTQVLYRRHNESISSSKLGEIKYFYDVQVKDQDINRIYAGFNTIVYILNAVKKHFF